VTVVHDLIRGDVEFAHDTIEDFVCVKSNGDPLFVLASVVDDIDMAITHVIRGEEHLPTTPKAILIWRALGDHPLPAYAHLPVLVNERREKLSKRRDRVALEDFRDLGYLPEAMRNYLVLLGWGPGGDRELLSVEEMIDEFRLEDVNRSPAFFDEKRLAHFNGIYLRGLSHEDFLSRARPFLDPPHARWPEAALDLEVFDRVAPLVQERIATLGEVAGYVEFLFADPFVVDPASFDKAIARDDVALPLLRETEAAFADCRFDHETLREVLIAIGERFDKKLAKAQAPVRVATMGRSVGLPLFESLEVLGREVVLSRLADAITAATESTSPDEVR
jgi:glutamyl-tRNA synthetase